MKRGARRMEELVLFNYEDGDSYYNIVCEGYAEEYGHYQYQGNRFEQLNLVETSFDYSMDGYGWGVGHSPPVYTYDIKNMYEQLCLLKAETIDKLCYTFKSLEFYAGYYIKATINNKVHNLYEAHFEILDVTECVEFEKWLSEDELDEQIRNFGNCAKRFPVRSAEP